MRKYKGWDEVTMPEPTAENMHILLEKINELTEAVNQLRKVNGLLKESLEDE